MGAVVTASEIEFGGSATYQLVAGDDLALRAGYGQPRLYDLEPTEPNCTVSLPDARRLRPGVRHFVLLNKSNAETVDVYAQDGTTKLLTMAVSSAVELHLASNATANGTWIAQTVASYGRGIDLGTNRYPVTLVVNQTLDRPNISFLAQQKGWDGVSPVAMVITVNSVATIRNQSNVDTGTPEPSLKLEGFPANSTFLLVNFGIIAGRGGRGGAGGTFSGGPTTPRTSGQPGGSAISIDQNLVLANFGVIAGGGGGGVGTSYASGGGGAGLNPGRGGVTYSPTAIAGGNGSQLFGGNGAGTGSTASGAGGNRGADGASNLTAEPLLTGGAKGWAILRIGSPTITTINAGTQFGGTS